MGKLNKPGQRNTRRGYRPPPPGHDAVLSYGRQLAAQGKLGKPTTYQPFYPDLVRRYADTAVATMHQVAMFLNTTVSTLYKWRDQHPTFAEALKHAANTVDARVEASLAFAAIGYSHPEEILYREQDPKTGQMVTVRETTTKHYKPDTVAAIYWTKNRMPERWRDMRDMNLGNLPPPEKLQALSDGQIDILVTRVARALFGATQDDNTPALPRPD